MVLKRTSFYITVSSANRNLEEKCFAGKKIERLNLHRPCVTGLAIGLDSSLRPHYVVTKTARPELTIRQHYVANMIAKTDSESGSTQRQQMY